jgi:NAD(P)-dependent dehydrogenase (short-subunit alcohol dehydrogenase family)
VTLLECDTSSLHSVQKAAQRLAFASSRLDILICSAEVSASRKDYSTDGYEVRFGTNHLGHALLIKLLLPLLRGTAQEYGDARIVSLTSQDFVFAPNGGIDFDTLRYNKEMRPGANTTRFGQSKLANLLYIDELARRNPQVTCVAADPWASSTWPRQGNLFTRAFTFGTSWLKGQRTDALERSADNQLWAATAPREEIPVNGGLYRPVGTHIPAMGYLKDDALRERLWDWTERELEKYTL